MDECGDKPPALPKMGKSCKETKKHMVETCVYYRGDPSLEMPDKELTSWQRIVKERKDISKKIETKIKREPINSLMHSQMKIRAINERKIIMEKAQVETKAELRGGLWEQPSTLHKRCTYYEPNYEVHRTKDDLGKPTGIEYVDVPAYISTKEQGITGTDKKSFPHSSYMLSKYGIERQKQLETKIRRLEPYRPSTRDLIITGEKPKTTIPKVPIPQIKTELVLGSGHKCEYESGIVALRINNSVFIKKHPTSNLDSLRKLQCEKWHEKKTEWTYYFNAPINNFSRNKLFLQNLGTVRLRYCWTSVKPECKSMYFPIDQVFFFNKNEDILCPGQTREIVFLCKSNRAGMFQEIWKLGFCNFDIPASDKKFEIILNADTFESNLNNFKKEVIALNRSICEEDRNYGIELILKELVDRAVDVPPRRYAYEKMFLDRDLFIMKNPDCYYHQTEVEKLKQLYKSIKKSDEAQWDLSLETLDKEIVNLLYTERMEKYDILKSVYQILITPWEEDADIDNLKFSATKDMLCEFVDRIDSDDMRLRQVYNPNMYKGTLVQRMKYNDIRRELLYMTTRARFSDMMESNIALLSSIDLFKPIDFK